MGESSAAGAGQLQVPNAIKQPLEPGAMSLPVEEDNTDDAGARYSMLIMPLARLEMKTKKMLAGKENVEPNAVGSRMEDDMECPTLDADSEEQPQSKVGVQQNGVANGQAPGGSAALHPEEVVRWSNEEGQGRENDALLPPDSKATSSQPAAAEPEQHAAASERGGAWDVVVGSLQDEFRAMAEGFSYICSSANRRAVSIVPLSDPMILFPHLIDQPNRDVAALTLLKASGAWIWSVSDVLNVRFAEMPEMQTLGDAAFTLGIFFMMVGVGCFLGPLIFNTYTPPKHATSCF